MINFAIISNKIENGKKYEMFVNKIMIDYEICYSTYIFSQNDKKLEEICKDNVGFMVFIIEHDNTFDSESLLYEVREKYDLYMPFVIIIDKNKELDILKIIEKHSFLCKIIQSDDELSSLKFDIKYILNVINNKKEVLTFIYDRILYKIPYKDILFIEKELNSKKCVIVCKNNSYETYISIVQLQKILDDRFIKTHQSALINSDNVIKIDFNESKIYFVSKKECNLLSRSMKKNLKEQLAK